MNKLSLAGGPYVVATLSSFDGNFPPVGDIVEVRLDKTGQPADWLERCRALEQRGKPVLLTIRLRAEGGDWPADDEARLKLYEQALPVLSAVDVELRSAMCGAVTTRAAELGKLCIVSHHDFEKTPPMAELESIIAQAQQNGAVAKVATLIRDEADLTTLESLLGKKRKQPVCIIGMGEQWKQTRVTFPKLGSFLTYGYLDKPTAPGQFSAAELVRRLSSI